MFAMTTADLVAVLCLRAEIYASWSRASVKKWNTALSCQTSHVRGGCHWVMLATTHDTLPDDAPRRVLERPRATSDMSKTVRQNNRQHAVHRLASTRRRLRR